MIGGLTQHAAAAAAAVLHIFLLLGFINKLLPQQKALFMLVSNFTSTLDTASGPGG